MVPDGAAAADDRQRRRAAGSPTARRPRPRRRSPPRPRRPAGRRAARARASSTRAPTPHTADRITSGRARDVRPSKRYVGVVGEHEDAGDRHHARRRRRPPWPGAGSTRPSPRRRAGRRRRRGRTRRGTPRQAHGEHAAEDRGRVDPAVPRVARLAAGRDPARGDAADDGAEAVRHQDRREREGSAEVAPVPGPEHRLAEREAGARGARCPSAARVSGTNRVSVIEAYASGKQVHSTHEDEDQPDVVGLPHRGDRVVDDLAGPLAALRRRRRRGPRSRHRSRRRRRSRTSVIATNRTTAAAVLIGPCARPPVACRPARARARTGTSASSNAASPRRNRRLISRSTRIVVTPSPT